MFSVDRIENNYVILINNETNKILEVDKDLLNFDILEGDILEFVDNKYVKNLSLTDKKKNDVRLRFNKLKK